LLRCCRKAFTSLAVRSCKNRLATRNGAITWSMRLTAFHIGPEGHRFLNGLVFSRPLSSVMTDRLNGFARQSASQQFVLLSPLVARRLSCCRSQPSTAEASLLASALMVYADARPAWHGCELQAQSHWRPRLVYDRSVPQWEGGTYLGPMALIFREKWQSFSQKRSEPFFTGVRSGREN
jgi:hypothetical protein